jgi:hypothetical protein
MAQPGGPCITASGVFTPSANGLCFLSVPGVANKTIEVVRLEMGFNTATSAVVGIQLGIATANTGNTMGGTVTIASASGTGASSAFAPTLWSAGTAAASAATGWSQRLNWYVNVLSGLVYLPVPEERIQLNPGASEYLLAGFLAAAVPPAVSTSVNLVYREIW